MNRPAVFLSAALWAFAAMAARAEHAKITLDVSSPSGAAKTAYVDQTPPPSGKNPRPVVKARVNEPLKVQFTLTNVYPKKTLENVVVHLFVVKQEKLGQRELPEIGDDVVLESAFEMDFKPGAKAGMRNTLKIDKPGVYLVRIETRQTNSDHEHFAAIDLVVE